jgi:asparagine synthase (glutamine-hydrolysing)
MPAMGRKKRTDWRMPNLFKPPARFVLNLWQALVCLRGEPLRRKILAARVRSEGLTYLPMQKIAKVLSAIRGIEAAGVAGRFIEAGCALGGSSILIASAKNPDRRFSVHDVFGMIPPPGPRDPEDVHRRYETIKSGQARGLAGQSYYGYRDGLRGEVERNFRRHGIHAEKNRVEFIEGLVQDTLQVRESVAFAHIDVDWHDPVKVCLERIHPHLATGGCVILDDYDDWGGCRKAVEDFLAGFGGCYEVENSHRSFSMRKTAS